MPNILDLRRRIRSVRNTRQITRAMKMVAGARLRRAQERILHARPYAAAIRGVLESVAARVDLTEEGVSPLLAVREVRKVLLVLVTADRGLCGAFNSNLVRAAHRYLEEHSNLEVSMLAVGRKGYDHFRKRPVALAGEYVNIFSKLEFGSAQAIAAKIIELYSSAAVDAVDFLYNEFKSIMTQRVVVERYLPVPPVKPAEGQFLVDYIYEQPPKEIFSLLLPRYVESQVYRALLESQAAELAAKTTAMDAATRNAGEMIDKYTLTMNRMRQAAITKEIIEIVSGAQAQQE
ncbi:MAG TPA: ATP synthase F1 subunit gamma [Terriglobia bacterium]|jgi:F-type H+-transporting ATPase subunit gamma|nr:ATP synthase F1 subunit gamma [Terriglobia bacterium]